MVITKLKRLNEFPEDEELIEDVVSDDDAPVQVVYRCKKCGQILAEGAKDCWKCSSKEIEEVVEEETKELKKVLLQSRIEKLENDVKSLKKNNDFLYVLFALTIVFSKLFCVKYFLI